MRTWRVVVQRKSKLPRFLFLAIHSGLPHLPAAFTEQHITDASIDIDDLNVRADSSQVRGTIQSQASSSERLPSFSRVFDNTKRNTRDPAPVNVNETLSYEHWYEACASHDVVSGTAPSVNQTASLGMAAATLPATLSYEQSTASSCYQPMQPEVPCSACPVNDTLNAATLWSRPYSATMDHTWPLKRQQVGTMMSDDTYLPGGEAKLHFQPPVRSTIGLSHGTDTIILVNKAQSKWKDHSSCPPAPVDLPHGQRRMVEGASDAANCLLALSSPAEQQSVVATHTPSATNAALNGTTDLPSGVWQSSDFVLPDICDRDISIPFSADNGQVSHERVSGGARQIVMTDNDSGRAEATLHFQPSVRSTIGTPYGRETLSDVGEAQPGLAEHDACLPFPSVDVAQDQCHMLDPVPDPDRGLLGLTLPCEQPQDFLSTQSPAVSISELEGLMSPLSNIDEISDLLLPNAWRGDNTTQTAASIGLVPASIDNILVTSARVANVQDIERMAQGVITNNDLCRAEATIHFEPRVKSTIWPPCGTETLSAVEEAQKDSEKHDARLLFLHVDVAQDQGRILDPISDPARGLLDFTLPYEKQQGISSAHSPAISSISELEGLISPLSNPDDTNDLILTDTWGGDTTNQIAASIGLVSANSNSRLVTSVRAANVQDIERMSQSVMTNNDLGKAEVNSAENAEAASGCAKNQAVLEHHTFLQSGDFDAICAAPTKDLTSMIEQSSPSVRQSCCSGAIPLQLQHQTAEIIHSGLAPQTATSQKALSHAKRHSDHQSEEGPAPKHNRKGIEAGSVMSKCSQTGLIEEQQADTADKSLSESDGQTVCNAFLAFAKDFSLLSLEDQSWEEILARRREDICKACSSVLQDEDHRAWSDAIRYVYQMIDPKRRLSKKSVSGLGDLYAAILRRLKFWPRRMNVEKLKEPERDAQSYYEQAVKGRYASRSILLESMDGLAVYHYLLMWECGQTLVKEFMTNPPINRCRPDPWLLWRERLLPLILKNRSEIIAISPYVKCLILGAVTYSVVSKALGLEGSKYWGRCPLSAEAAKQICKIVRMIMYQGYNRWQVEEDEFAELRILLLECQGDEFCTERGEPLLCFETPTRCWKEVENNSCPKKVNHQSLKIASTKTNSGPSVFFLDALANLFEDITTLSTTSEKHRNGPKWVPSNVKQVITQSTNAEALRYRKSLMKLHNAMSGAIFHKNGTRGRQPSMGPFVTNFHEIIKRAVTFAGACSNDFEARERRYFMTRQRRTLRDFVDLMGLATRVSTSEKSVQILKELYPATLLLLPHCAKIPTFSFEANTRKAFEEAVMGEKACQEIIVLSALYHVLDRNLSSDQDLYHDYSALTEEDLLELCGKVKAFFSSLKEPDPKVDVMRLPRATVDRIKQRLTRPSDSI